jgi:hypothetical protein
MTANIVAVLRTKTLISLHLRRVGKEIEMHRHFAVTSATRQITIDFSRRNSENEPKVDALRSGRLAEAGTLRQTLLYIKAPHICKSQNSECVVFPENLQTLVLVFQDHLAGPGLGLTSISAIRMVTAVTRPTMSASFGYRSCRICPRDCGLGTRIS